MNKLLTLGIAGLLSIAMTGCTTSAQNVEIEIPTTERTDVNEIDTGTETGDSYYISPTDDVEIGDVIIVGDIMQFDSKYIHIISGDLVQVYKYDNNNQEDFYLGQMVQLIKGEKEDTITSYEKDDYTISYTNMGQMIDQISGTLEKVTDEIIIVKTKNGNVEIKTYEAITGTVGDEVTVYTVRFGAKDSTPSAIMTLNENSKLLLTVAEVTRDDDGSMILSLTDADNGEYTINASHVSMELNVSKLAVNDTLNVYHNGIMESLPMQLDTILIRK